jgi:hypothetical protein
MGEKAFVTSTPRISPALNRTAQRSSIRIAEDPEAETITDAERAKLHAAFTAAPRRQCIGTREGIRCITILSAYNVDDPEERTCRVMCDTCHRRTVLEEMDRTAAEIQARVDADEFARQSVTPGTPEYEQRKLDRMEELKEIRAAHRRTVDEDTFAKGVSLTRSALAVVDDVFRATDISKAVQSLHGYVMPIHARTLRSILNRLERDGVIEPLPKGNRQAQHWRKIK